MINTCLYSFLLCFLFSSYKAENIAPIFQLFDQRPGWMIHDHVLQMNASHYLLLKPKQFEDASNNHDFEIGIYDAITYICKSFSTTGSFLKENHTTFSYSYSRSTNSVYALGGLSQKVVAIYKLDLGTLEWTQIQLSTSNKFYPNSRLNHSTICISIPKEQNAANNQNIAMAHESSTLIVMYGGEIVWNPKELSNTTWGKIRSTKTNECWLFDIQQKLFYPFGYSPNSKNDQYFSPEAQLDSHLLSTDIVTDSQTPDDSIHHIHILLGSDNFQNLQEHWILSVFFSRSANDMNNNGISFSHQWTRASTELYGNYHKELNADNCIMAIEKQDSSILASLYSLSGGKAVASKKSILLSDPVLFAAGRVPPSLLRSETSLPSGKGIAEVVSTNAFSSPLQKPSDAVSSAFFYDGSDSLLFEMDTSFLSYSLQSLEERLASDMQPRYSSSDYKTDTFSTSSNSFVKTRFALKERPPSRTDFTSTYLPEQNSLIVFGGRNSGLFGQAVLGDCYMYDLTLRRWVQEGNVKKQREGRIMSTTVKIAEMSGDRRDLWSEGARPVSEIFRTEVGENDISAGRAIIKKFIARYGHSATVCHLPSDSFLLPFPVATGSNAPSSDTEESNYRECLIVFGGTDGTNVYNDILVYDPKVHSWNCIKYYGTGPALGSFLKYERFHKDDLAKQFVLYGAPPPRIYTSMTRVMPLSPSSSQDHPFRELGIVIHGGMNEKTHTVYNDTYFFDLESGLWRTPLRTAIPSMPVKELVMLVDMFQESLTHAINTTMSDEFDAKRDEKAEELVQMLLKAQALLEDAQKIDVNPPSFGHTAHLVSVSSDAKTNPLILFIGGKQTKNSFVSSQQNIRCFDPYNWVWKPSLLLPYADTSMFKQAAESSPIAHSEAYRYASDYSALRSWFTSSLQLYQALRPRAFTNAFSTAVPFAFSQTHDVTNELWGRTVSPHAVLLWGGSFGYDVVNPKSQIPLHLLEDREKAASLSLSKQLFPTPVTQTQKDLVVVFPVEMQQDKVNAAYQAIKRTHNNYRSTYPTNIPVNSQTIPPREANKQSTTTTTTTTTSTTTSAHPTQNVQSSYNVDSTTASSASSKKEDSTINQASSVPPPRTTVMPETNKVLDPYTSTYSEHKITQQSVTKSTSYSSLSLSPISSSISSTSSSSSSIACDPVANHNSDCSSRANSLINRLNEHKLYLQRILSDLPIIARKYQNDVVNKNVSNCVNGLLKNKGRLGISDRTATCLSRDHVNMNIKNLPSCLSSSSDTQYSSILSYDWMPEYQARSTIDISMPFQQMISERLAAFNNFSYLTTSYSFDYNLHSRKPICPRFSVRPPPQRVSEGGDEHLMSSSGTSSSAQCGWQQVHSFVHEETELIQRFVEQLRLFDADSVHIAELQNKAEELQQRFPPFVKALRALLEEDIGRCIVRTTETTETVEKMTTRLTEVNSKYDNLATDIRPLLHTEMQLNQKISNVTQEIIATNSSHDSLLHQLLDLNRTVVNSFQTRLKMALERKNDKLLRVVRAQERVKEAAVALVGNQLEMFAEGEKISTVLQQKEWIDEIVLSAQRLLHQDESLENWLMNEKTKAAKRISDRKNEEEKVMNKVKGWIEEALHKRRAIVEMRQEDLMLLKKKLTLLNQIQLQLKQWSDIVESSEAIGKLRENVQTEMDELAKTAKTHIASKVKNLPFHHFGSKKSSEQKESEEKKENGASASSSDSASSNTITTTTTTTTTSEHTFSSTEENSSSSTTTTTTATHSDANEEAAAALSSRQEESLSQRIASILSMDMIDPSLPESLLQEQYRNYSLKVKRLHDAINDLISQAQRSLDSAVKNATLFEESVRSREAQLIQTANELWRLILEYINENLDIVELEERIRRAMEEIRRLQLLIEKHRDTRGSLEKDLALLKVQLQGIQSQLKSSRDKLSFSGKERTSITEEYNSAIHKCAVTLEECEKAPFTSFQKLIDDIRQFLIELRILDLDSVECGENLDEALRVISKWRKLINQETMSIWFAPESEN